MELNLRILSTLLKIILGLVIIKIMNRSLWIHLSFQNRCSRSGISYWDLISDIIMLACLNGLPWLCSWFLKLAYWFWSQHSVKITNFQFEFMQLLFCISRNNWFPYSFNWACFIWIKIFSIWFSKLNLIQLCCGFKIISCLLTFILKVNVSLHRWFNFISQFIELVCFLLIKRFLRRLQLNFEIYNFWIKHLNLNFKWLHIHLIALSSFNFLSF